MRETLKGNRPGVVLCQKEADSEAGQNTRDVVVHLMGLLFNFDMDLELSDNQRATTTTLEPWQKAELGLDDPDEPALIWGYEANVLFGSIPTKSSVQVVEVEFYNNVLTSEGVSTRMMRIITFQPTNWE